MLRNNLHYPKKSWIWLTQWIIQFPKSLISYYASPPILHSSSLAASVITFPPAQKCLPHTSAWFAILFYFIFLQAFFQIQHLWKVHHDWSFKNYIHPVDLPFSTALIISSMHPPFIISFIYLTGNANLEQCLPHSKPSINFCGIIKCWSFVETFQIPSTRLLYAL